MKVIKSSLLILLIWQGSILAAQESNYTIDTTRSGDPMLFGTVTPKAFLQPPFSEWFTKSTNANQVDQAVMQSRKLQKSLNKHDITIYMGTWCGDSRKEVPLVIKSLNESGYDMSRLKIITLNQQKQGAKREELGNNIHRVPTIIFSKDGKEKGRIVEHPISTIEKDIVRIVTSNKYQPNYNGLQVIHEAIVKNGFEALKSEQLFDEVKPLIQKDYELYKYGLIYFRNKEYNKAFAIYDFNAKLFPLSDRPYQSKGISYYLMNDLIQSKTNLEKALNINPENKSAQKYLALIANSGEGKVASNK